MMVESILTFIENIGVTHLFGRMSILWLYSPFIFTKKVKNALRAFGSLSEEYTRKSVKKHEDGVGRAGFLSNMLKHEKTDADVSFKWLVDNSAMLMAAGTETTSTTMSCLTCKFDQVMGMISSDFEIDHLLKHPEKMEILKEEVRSSFSSVSEIDMDSTLKLPYLAAVSVAHSQCPPDLIP